MGVNAGQLLQMLKDCMRLNSDLIGQWHGTVKISITDETNRINHTISCWQDKKCPSCGSEKPGFPYYQGNGGITGSDGRGYQERTGTDRLWRCRQCHVSKTHNGPTGIQ